MFSFSSRAAAAHADRGGPRGVLDARSGESVVPGGEPSPRRPSSASMTFRMGFGARSGQRGTCDARSKPLADRPDVGGPSSRGRTSGSWEWSAATEANAGRVREAPRACGPQGGSRDHAAARRSARPAWSCSKTGLPMGSSNHQRRSQRSLRRASRPNLDHTTRPPRRSHRFRGRSAFVPSSLEKK